MKEGPVFDLREACYTCPMSPFAELQAELQAISDLNASCQILQWDQQVNMPPAGAAARGRQIALLGQLAHERLTAPKMGTLFGALASRQDEDSVEGATLRAARRRWEKATKIPASLVSEIRTHNAKTFTAWADAKATGNFSAVQPLLEKNVELSRRWAACFNPEHIGDPLIDHHDRGMNYTQVKALFEDLRGELVPLVEKLCAAPQPESEFLRRHYPKADQLRFGMMVSQALGYDLKRGRQDETAHPFMIRFAAGDIRITTRVNENAPTEALFGTIHETGHALYELNIDPAFDATPLGSGASAGVHESQSRLWENIVGRSLPFWKHFYPSLQDTFASQLKGIDVEVFHRAINRVRPSLIRVAADEVTYNLHVMLRFDLEMQLLDGSLAVKDLPEAWNARIESDLGIKPKHAGEGCMQDVHWFCETIGGTFQGYTLGNLMSAQFYEAAADAVPMLDRDFAEGDFEPLRRWLTENLYQHGSRYTPDELVERATGKPLSAAPFMNYLKGKYSALYDIEL